MKGRLSVLVTLIMMLCLLGACGTEAPSQTGGQSQETVSASPTSDKDSTPPTTDLEDVSTWQRGPVNLKVTVTDDRCASGECVVYTSLNGKSNWKKGSFVALKKQGRNSVWMYGVDASGNEETAHYVEVYLDNRPPVTVALNSPTVVKGKSTTLKFRVNDNSETASASIRLSGPAKRTLSVGEVDCRSVTRYELDATGLPIGTYTYTVFARDLAGNSAKSRGSGHLTVASASVAYKASCKSVTYRVIDKNADQVVGRRYVFNGQIVQIQDAGSGQYWSDFEDYGVYPRTQGLIAVTPDGWGGYENNVSFVTEGAMRNVFEDDVITIWGECLGTYSYESVAGWNLTVPLIEVKFYEK